MLIRGIGRSSPLGLVQPLGRDGKSHVRLSAAANSSPTTGRLRSRRRIPVWRATHPLRWDLAELSDLRHMSGDRSWDVSKGRRQGAWARPLGPLQAAPMIAELADG